MKSHKQIEHIFNRGGSPYVFSCVCDNTPCDYVGYKDTLSPDKKGLVDF